MLQLLSWRSPTEKDQGIYYFASCIFVPRELQTMLHTSVFPARICIWLVLQCAHEDFFGLLAIVCSSWVPINIATSKRSVVLPEGNTSLSYVANANCMCSRCLGLQLCVCTVYCHSIYSRSQGHSVVLFLRTWNVYVRGDVVFTNVLVCICFTQHLRTVLICALIVARGGTFFLEQPGGSYMEYFDKMRWLYERVPVPWHHDVKTSHDMS